MSAINPSIPWDEMDRDQWVDCYLRLKRYADWLSSEDPENPRSAKVWRKIQELHESKPIWAEEGVRRHEGHPKHIVRMMLGGT